MQLHNGPDLRMNYLEDIKEKKKPSTWQDLTPRPQEFCSAVVCSTSVLQPLPRGLQSWFTLKFNLFFFAQKKSF